MNDVVTVVELIDFLERRDPTADRGLFGLTTGILASNPFTNFIRRGHHAL